jgi:hypothetical protein
MFNLLVYALVNAFILILFLTGYGDEVFLAMANLEYRFLLGIGLAIAI